MTELESLKAEYTLLVTGEATQVSWEEYREDFLAVKHRQQDLYHQAKLDEFKTTSDGQWRIICWFVGAINSLFTVACPLYAPVGVTTQILLYKLIK